MRQQRKMVAYVVVFLFGLVLASGLDWTDGSEAVRAQAVLPSAEEVRQLAELGSAFTAIADAVTPAVVRIQAEQVPDPAATAGLPRGFHDFFGPPGGGGPVPQLAGGSGFLVSQDGYILTNNHVIEGAERISVSLVDKRTFEARVVGRDPTTDVAVVKIEARGLPAVRFGDSDAVRVGEWVLAIGNPGFDDASTLDFTVTSGIISAKGRPLEIINRDLAQRENPAANYAIEDFLQTDAVINPGNSGGPLVNLRGEVIGMNTAIASGTGFYQGYGFAIPANLARRVMRDLVEHGHVRRALLGITIDDVTAEDAEVYRLPEISGVVVEDFAADAPARRAGLRRHDVIVAVDGHPVERVGQLQRLVAQRRPGESVQVEVIRYGERHRFRVRLAQAPIASVPGAARESPARPRPEMLGLTVEELTPSLARELGFERAGGAVVSAVADFSPALQKGVLQWDRIVSIDRTPVGSAREARRLLRQVPSGQVVSLLLEDSAGRTRIANIRAP